MSAMVANFHEIFEVFSQKSITFHIGVTTASLVPENPPMCTGIGSLVQGRAADECIANKLGGLPYMTSEVHGDDSNVFWDAFFCILGAGAIVNPSEELENSRPVEAALWALHPDLNTADACNQGFARPDAPLLVFLFTNVDQPNSNGLPAGYNHPGGWWSLLNEERSGMSTRDRSALVLIAGPTGAEPVDGCETAAPQRIETFTSVFSADLTRQFNICDTKNCPMGDLTAITTFLLESLQTLVCSVCESQWHP